MVRAVGARAPRLRRRPSRPRRRLLVAGPARSVPVVASAQTAPPPPPGGSAAGPARPREVGRLVAQLSTLQTQLDDLADQAGQRQELANRAVADDTAARARVERHPPRRRRLACGRRPTSPRDAEATRKRVDDWVAAQYQQADASSIASALAGTHGPQDVADRLQLQGLVTAEQSHDLEGYERARVDAANADSRARAAAAQAADAASRAAAARDAAARELAAARTPSPTGSARSPPSPPSATRPRRGSRRWRPPTPRSPPSAAAPRPRRPPSSGPRTPPTPPPATPPGRGSPARRHPRQHADPRRPRRRPAADPAPTPDPRQDPVQIVLDRALSELGTTYAWGGGDADGPTQGIRDGGVADASATSTRSASTAPG